MIERRPNFRRRTDLRIAAQLALLLAIAGPPAWAARKSPEAVRGGPSKAERIARMQATHAEVTATLPAGFDAAPIFVDITREDRDAVDHAPRGRLPLRVGVVKRIAEFVGKPEGRHEFRRGAIKSDPGKGFVWAATISSPGAQAIRLHIEDLSLPGGAELFLLGDNGQADGPYLARGRNGDGDFWTRSIVGETGTIVVRYRGNRPGINMGRTTFVVTEVAHIRGRPRPRFRSHDSWPCADNAPCLVDAECAGTSAAVNDAKAAVAKLEWLQGPFVNTCTGGLIADTDTGTDNPLMLSANHCFSGDISNLETFFSYTTGSCNGGCPDSRLSGSTPPPSDTVGMTVDATSRTSDYTLFTLSEPAPAGAVFLGWNTTPVAHNDGFNLYRISNANFGPQVYSEHSVDTDSPTCSGITRGAWIYSKDTLGGTMGGSSGSPIVNSAGEIVGQLTGCCGYNCGDECDPASNWTIDGAFANYFSDVESILDPQGGCTSNAECDDGLYCTGNETCAGGVCQSSGDPCVAGDSCNEAADSCDPVACDDDGACEPGEDCGNCPTDCASKLSGNPNSRYCCDGDVEPDCGDGRCNEGGFSCGDTSCAVNSDCEDNLFCTGTETCAGGSCQSSGDPCSSGQSCDEGSDSCVTCGANKAPCSSNPDCCSNNCRGGRCKGN